MSAAEYLETSPADEGGAEPNEVSADAVSRSDEAAAEEAETKKTEQKKPSIRERYRALYYKSKADGRLFKVGIALVTAVIAACIIVIAGIVSERRLGVVFLRAAIGFFVSGTVMGAALYWLDRFGIPLFIAKHGDQLQMEWISEAEEPEEIALEMESAGAPEDEPPRQPAPKEAEPPTAEEGGADASPSEKEETREEIDDTVLDDAFSSSSAEPSFAPMSADTLEHYSAPSEG